MDISLDDEQIAFPKKPKLQFVWCSKLVTWLNAIFGFHNPFYHKPIQQQPFNKYSSILHTHSFPNKRGNHTFQQKNQHVRISFIHYRENKAQTNFPSTCQLQLSVLPENTLVNKGILRNICVLQLRNWLTTINNEKQQQPGDESTTELAKSWQLWLNI